MTSTVTTTAGNVVVVTHVHPNSEHVQGSDSCLRSQKFNKVWPMALGTVQIMIGAMMLLFGIASAVYESLGVYSGIFVWGAGVYIASGSLTITAGKFGSRCQINASMVLNIIAAIVSVIGVVMYSLDVVVRLGPYDRIFQGFSGVLAVFHLLELIVSILVASIACNATCSCCAEPPPRFIPAAAPAMNAPASSYQVQAAPVAHAQFSAPPAPVMDYAKNPNDGRMTSRPPAYDAPM